MSRRFPPALVLAVCVFGACASPPPPPSELPQGLRHERGTQFASTRAHYSTPILQKSFFWDGNGEVNNSGIGLHYGKFVDDRIALGLGSTIAGWWTGGRDIYSAEVEGLLRVYPVRDLPVFFDGTGGYQLATHRVPPGGTVWNYSFAFGGGVEIPVDRGAAVQIGALYHHISNALGRESPRNPSQNELRLWLGFVWEF